MITEIVGHEFKTKKKSRFLYEFEGVDLEQHSENDLYNLINVIKSQLVNLPSKAFFKFYYLNNKFYLDSPIDEHLFESLHPSSLKTGVSDFLLNDNLYSDIVFPNDYVKVNGNYFRFVGVMLNSDNVIDFSSLVGVSEYFITFKKIKTNISKDMVDAARKMNHASLYRALADIEGIEVYQENEAMLRRIVSREEELFVCELVFLVRSKTEEELSLKTDTLLKELEARSFSPKIETAALNKVFTSYFPGMEPLQQNERLVHGSLLANFIPVHKDKCASIDDVTFHSRSDYPVYFSTAEGDSFSTLITGITGKGKTFCAQKILTNELRKGRTLFCIDPKRDYEKFAILNNAHIVEGNINPMQFKDPLYLRDLILSKIPLNSRVDSFDGQLLKSIRETGAYLCDDFFDALELISKDSKALNGIELYFEDVKGKISTDIIKDSQFIYVLSSSFTKETLPLLLVFSMEYLKRIGGEYRLVIDEAHRVFATNPTFLDERIREMRVTGSGLVTITQSYKDLLRTDFGKIVADCSHHKIFFSQTLESGDMGISDFDLSKIRSLVTVKNSFSEFYYKTDTIRKVLRFYPTVRELEVFRSGEGDRKSMLEYIQEKLKFFSIDEAIDQYVRDKYAAL